LVKEVSALTVKDGVSSEYLYHLFRTRQFLDLMDVYATGEMSHRIFEEDLKSIKIPVPPLDVARAARFCGFALVPREGKNDRGFKLWNLRAANYIYAMDCIYKI
jgi:hypothetical protein